MRIPCLLTAYGALSAAFSLGLCAQGLPPRVAPTDYQSHASAGKFTIATESSGHSVPTLEGTFTADEYICLETGLFGPPDSKLTISIENFSVRINGKKQVPAEQFGLVFKELKDPEWIPPDTGEKKSKTSLGGGGQSDSGPVVPPKMPLPLRRAMEQKVQKASMPEGERALPVAGLLYFPYRGKIDRIHSLELIYQGPAGKATLKVRP